MNGKTYRCVLCYRLGVPLFSVSKSCSACSKVFIGDVYGDHAVSCAGVIGIKHRHNAVRDTLVDICFRSGISAGKEVDIGLSGDGDKALRHADILIYSWDGGLDVCVDLTGSSPLTQTGMTDFAPAIGYGFLPFSFSSLGELEANAVTLLKRIRKFSMVQDIGARAAIHIFNRISFAIAKGVGAQIVSRLPSNLLPGFTKPDDKFNGNANISLTSNTASSSNSEDEMRERGTPVLSRAGFVMCVVNRLRFEIGLKDCSRQNAKIQQMVMQRMRNKEKLEEIAITTLGALKHTRMTLELANRSVTHPMGIAEDVVVRVDGFTFLADFVVVNFEPDPRVPIILGRPFLRTAKALIDLYEEKLTLRVGSDELNNEDDIDEIDAFLAMEVSSNFEEGYFDSEGDVIFLENLLSDDTTHNLAPEVISDHEPKQDESIHNTSITFSPRSDPLHHEFAGELITLPSRITREHEDYLSRMTLLCEISTSRSQENVHANPSSIIESLPTSLIPVEDNDPVQEEIDIFLVPDDLIPPGVENDDSEDEDIELPNNDHQDNPSSPRPPPEPPDVCLNFKPATAMRNEDFNQGEIVLSLNVEDVNSFTFVIWTFLPFFTYPEDSPVILSLRSEDLVFDPGISTFHFSLKPVPFALPKDE
ncbi:putative reverse transcriptase domain-containing protein [Tanacetum coccineum]